MRELLKLSARLLANFIVLPLVVGYRVLGALAGADRALEGCTQLLSLLPGLSGEYIRRAFLGWALEECHPSATVRFGCTFSKTAARVGAGVYIGPRCQIGWALIEQNVLIAAGVHVTSGARTHGYDDFTRPIRDQQGTPEPVRIGEGTWIGSTAVIMADVGRDSVVGAGAVVTKPVRDRVIAVGVPAREIRQRGATKDGPTLYEIQHAS